MSRAKDGERPLIDQPVAPRSDLGWRAGLGDHAAGRTVQQPSGLGRHCSASGGRWALRSAQSTRGFASYELRGGFISAVGRVSLGIMDRTGDHPSLKFPYSTGPTNCLARTRPTGSRRGATLSARRGCPTPAVSPRSTGCNRSQWRRGWFERVTNRLMDCDIVFADPDNGLYDNDSFQYDGRNSDWKRLPLREALELSENRTAVIYHHNTRFRGGLGREIEHWMGQLPGCNHAFRCRRNGNRTFFVLNADNATVVSLTAFVERWREAGQGAGFRHNQLSELVTQG